MQQFNDDSAGWWKGLAFLGGMALFAIGLGVLPKLTIGVAGFAVAVVYIALVTKS